ncbi:DUF3857 domain-containing transglutaminase family protein [Oryzicola mucosus]|uniref:DUF3857 domain-containing transglutaminase family protein n=1 Tax=Oryzicola mucosus TaxID=2767425 RepID=A0A8J6PHE0_9HYPH|nr:DUF3857 domain-containing transglutaminase family protein [Oryzicola mucosus]MBD0414108.1 DUF3857 domain-containing transglutaminase family protein [Oryzicola mucosus]
MFLAVLFISLSGYGLKATATETVEKGPVGEWVELVDLPEQVSDVAEQFDDGIANLLSDSQVRYRPEGYETFDRWAYRVTDRTGLEEGATASFTFNPATSTVTVNRIHIVRDGTTINQLEVAKFDVVRREPDAERGIFDGRLTVYIQLNDVRIGDIIDFARTTDTKPYVGPHLISTYTYASWYRPIGLIREKMIWPSDQPVTVKRYNTPIEPTVRAEGGLTSYSWEAKNPEPGTKEANTPPDEDILPAIHFSTARSWQDIVDAVLPHYKESALPEAFAAKLDDIAAKHQKPKDRLIEVMRLVQDDIRYVSLSMGSGSYIPRPPSAVVESGFGDCKDKALLLATSLRRLGISADVALTDIETGTALPNYLPSIYVFDHVIVRARIGVETFWIDATNYLQGGRADNLAPPPFGYALPLVSANAELEKITPRMLVEPTQFVDERFVFPRRDGDPLTLTVVTTYQGYQADQMRVKLRAQSAAKTAQSYLVYYANSYPGIEILYPLRTHDNRDSNVLMTIEGYNLPAEALKQDGLIEAFTIKADVGTSELPDPTRVGRKSPIWLGPATLKRHRVTAMNLKARFAGPEEDVMRVTSFGIFDVEWSNSKTTFELDWYLSTFADRVTVGEIGDYAKFLKHARENNAWNYDFAYVDAEKPETD